VLVEARRGVQRLTHTPSLWFLTISWIKNGRSSLFLMHLRNAPHCPTNSALPARLIFSM
jgi:hypothetical protein